jgi:DNA topoisomerase-1
MTRICMIVESPHKCATIQNYVGNDYNVIACYGHFRTIGSLDDISKDDYAIKFTDIKSKSSVISRMKKCINESSAVVIATDDDREGEAIGWHICDRFGLSMKTTRIIFNEVTQEAIMRALKTPTFINMSVVNAQKTRQVIDMLVGYKVSPQLWKSIGTQKLSAGRCQTPTLGLIYDNHKRISRQTQSMIFVTSGYFTERNIHFILNKEYDDTDDMNTFLNSSITYHHEITKSTLTKVTTDPPIPFDTISLQQASNTELRLTTRDTMNGCQMLYERGYITYMRTDSVKFSPEFLSKCFGFVSGNYGEEYVTSNPTNISTEVNSEKDETSAHEAIRPTNISLLIPEDVTKNACRLYTLIRNRTLMSCMREMISSVIRYKITAPMECVYSYKSSRIDFHGWNIVTHHHKTDETFDYLNTLKMDTIHYNKVVSSQHVKDVPRHYNESGLLTVMKRMGIGRPSTYSSIIETLKERKYVRYTNVDGSKYNSLTMELARHIVTTTTTQKVYGSEKNKLVIQPLGVDVVEFLYHHYGDLFSYTYSKEMEERLDLIVSNNVTQFAVCNDCNDTITKCTSTITTKSSGYKLDDAHTYINGKYGPVIKHINGDDVTFKPVIADIDIEKLKSGEYEASDIIKVPSVDIELGELDGVTIYLKSGKYGKYISYNTKTYSVPKGMDLDNINAIQIIQGIRELSDTISVRRGPKGTYIMIKNKGKKRPTFISLSSFKDDPYKCDVSLLMEVIDSKSSL